MSIIIRNVILIVILLYLSYTEIKCSEIDCFPVVIGCLFIIPFTLLGLNDISILQAVLAGFICFLITFLASAFGLLGGSLIKLLMMMGMFLGLRYIGIVIFMACIFCCIGELPKMLYGMLRGESVCERACCAVPYVTISFVTSLFFYDMFDFFVYRC